MLCLLPFSFGYYGSLRTVDLEIENPRATGVRTIMAGFATFSVRRAGERHPCSGPGLWPNMNLASVCGCVCVCAFGRLTVRQSLPQTVLTVQTGSGSPANRIKGEGKGQPFGRSVCRVSVRVVRTFVLNEVALVYPGENWHDGPLFVDSRSSR